MRHSLAWALLGIFSAFGCGSDASDAPLAGIAGRLHEKVSKVDDGPARQLAALRSEPGPQALAAILDVDLSRVTRALGPHELVGKCKYEALPSKLEPESDFPTPRLPGDLIREHQLYNEEISLRVGAPAKSPQFEFRQALAPNNAIEARGVGEFVFTRRDQQTWLRQPAELGVHKQWLDESYRLPLDMVLLAGQQLAISVADDPSIVQITLHAAAPGKLAPALASDPYRKIASWREKAALARVQGEVRLDADSGIWQSFRVELGFDAKDSGGEAVKITVHCDGTLQASKAAKPVEAPAQAIDLPVRERYAAHASELLQGLARPK